MANPAVGVGGLVIGKVRERLARLFGKKTPEPSVDSRTWKEKRNVLDGQLKAAGEGPDIRVPEEGQKLTLGDKFHNWRENRAYEKNFTDDMRRPKTAFEKAASRLGGAAVVAGVVLGPAEMDGQGWTAKPGQMNPVTTFEHMLWDKVEGIAATAIGIVPGVQKTENKPSSLITDWVAARGVTAQSGYLEEAAMKDEYGRTRAHPGISSSIASFSEEAGKTSGTQADEKLKRTQQQIQEDRAQAQREAFEARTGPRASAPKGPAPDIYNGF